MTAELGVDKIFGKGTTPGEVASYLAAVLAPGDDPMDPPRELAPHGDVAGVSAETPGAAA